MMKRKLMTLTIALFLILGWVACDTLTTPDVEEIYEAPEIVGKTVSRSWFYGKVGELESMGRKTLVQRGDWFADVLDELKIKVDRGEK